MYILGLNAYHPDSSACIIKDGVLLAAVEEERFRRLKHWAGFPSEAIRYCLNEAHIGLEEIDFIAINRDAGANFFKKAAFTLAKRPSLILLKDKFTHAFKITGVKDALSQAFSVPVQQISAKVYNIEHHRSHLASAFFVSPYQESVVVSIDGFGDFTSCMVALGLENKIKVLYEVNLPHSLGMFYTAFTQFLGFRKFGDEYKVMGLAAYGQPRYLKEMEDILQLKPKGKFSLNLEYFSFYKENYGMVWDNKEPILNDVYSDKLVKKFFSPRKYEDPLTQEHFDIAASLQAAYERAFFHVLNYVYEITRSKTLCLAGGCALNSVANGKIFDQTPFKDIYIQPNSSDAGGCLGAGYYLYHQILGQKRQFVMENAYWGPAFEDLQIKVVLDEKVSELNGCAITKFDQQVDLCRRTAELICQGKIIGWFQGRMEWGARALGNRSILVDPRRKEMKDVLNARIKKRESFRPFAPAILVERTGEYFEKDYPDPFMVKVYPVKADKRDLISAVVHVDGTGRLQTVSKRENPLFWQLITEFEKLSGVPVLLNTSFNENEPIVCRPQEALDCFLRTKMDVLVMGNFLIEKKA